MPAATSVEAPLPSAPSTRTGMIFAAGAVPATPIPLFVTAAAIPATCVPWPFRSCAPGEQLSLLTRSAPGTRLP